jgi:hypothetical protein
MNAEIKVATRIRQVCYFQKGERWNFAFGHSFIISAERRKLRNLRITT